jgi:hypothetical protein
MQLQEEDLEKIGHIVARRYFAEQGWNYTDLKLSGKNILESVDTINEQYDKYPYLSRDWYVENSAEKSIHMATRWDDLNILGNLLRIVPDQFDFLLKFNSQKSMCIVMQTELNDQKKNAIAEARKSGFNVYIFKTDVPETMDFELEEVVGGISGRVNFK